MNASSNNANVEELLAFYSKPLNHLAAKPPKEAYFFFPTKEEYIDFDPADPTTLTRFNLDGNMSSTFIEQEKIYYKEINDAIEKHNEKCKSKGKPQLIFPPDFLHTDIYRFHKSTKYVAKKTIEALATHIEWRTSFKSKIQLNSNILQLLNSGCVYTYGRDHSYRPVIVMNAKLFLDYQTVYDDEDFEKGACVFTDYIVNNLLIPGQIENWVSIVNMKDVSLLGIPDNIKKLISLLQNNYRGRLYKSFIIGLSGFTLFLWNIISSFLDKITAKKFYVLAENELYKINEFVHPSQLEKKFGGEAANLEYKFLFPPKAPPSNQFALKTDKNRLVSQEQYIKMVVEDKRIVECPFLKNDIKKYLKLLDKKKEDVNNKKEIKEIKVKKEQPEKAKIAIEVNESQTNYEEESILKFNQDVPKSLDDTIATGVCLVNTVENDPEAVALFDLSKFKKKLEESKKYRYNSSGNLPDSLKSDTSNNWLTIQYSVARAKSREKESKFKIADQENGPNNPPNSFSANCLNSPLKSDGVEEFFTPKQKKKIMTRNPNVSSMFSEDLKLKTPTFTINSSLESNGTGFGNQANNSGLASNNAQFTNNNAYDGVGIHRTNKNEDKIEFAKTGYGINYQNKERSKERVETDSSNHSEDRVNDNGLANFYEKESDVVACCGNAKSISCVIF